MGIAWQTASSDCFEKWAIRKGEGMEQVTIRSSAHGIKEKFTLRYFQAVLVFSTSSYCSRSQPYGCFYTDPKNIHWAICSTNHWSNSQGKDGRTPGDSSVEITLGRETPASVAISLKKQRATQVARRERHWEEIDQLLLIFRELSNHPQ